MTAENPPISSECTINNRFVVNDKCNTLFYLCSHILIWHTPSLLLLRWQWLRQLLFAMWKLQWMHLIWFMHMRCIFHHIKQHLTVLVRSTNSSCVNNQDKMRECVCVCVCVCYNICCLLLLLLSLLYFVYIYRGAILCLFFIFVSFCLSFIIIIHNYKCLHPL